ncbi:hypothetical protein AB0N05_29685 [Nocardia sp. NPDC051030]|uniref:hypothetical protein n=1 Tax=Nocardia sp. NPDC051030 TaxID=3155162 RepID=UPI00343EB8B2
MSEIRGAGYRHATFTESETPAKVSSTRGTVWILFAAAVCTLLTFVSLGASGYFLHQRDIAADREVQRAAYIQFAEQAITGVTNLDFDTAPDDFARVLAMASGVFAADLAKGKDDFSQLVQKAQVKAKGEVIEAALESSDDHSAQALVLVKQTLSNVGAEGPQVLLSRFRVTVARADDGKLSVTGMERMQ